MTPFQIAVKQIDAILLLCLVTMGVKYLQLFHIIIKPKIVYPECSKKFHRVICQSSQDWYLTISSIQVSKQILSIPTQHNIHLDYLLLMISHPTDHLINALSPI